MRGRAVRDGSAMAIAPGTVKIVVCCDASGGWVVWLLIWRMELWEVLLLRRPVRRNLGDVTLAMVITVIVFRIVVLVVPLVRQVVVVFG